MNIGENTRFNVPRFTSILELFATATHMPVSLVGDDGSVELSSGNPPVCDSFPFESMDHSGCYRNVVSGEFDTAPRWVSCPHGFMYLAVPVRIDGISSSFLIAGPVFSEDPDISSLEQTADSAGFNRDAYIAAIREIAVVPPQLQEPNGRYLADIAALMETAADGMAGVPSDQDAVHTQDREILEKAPVGYQSLDEHGCFLVVSTEWLAMSGYAREEVIGHWFGDFLDEDGVKAFKEVFPRLIKTGDIHNIEYRLRRKDGSYLTVLFEGRVTRDDNGCFMHTHCVMTDITERYRIEENLRESELRYRNLFEQTNDAILVGDLESLRYVDANRAAVKLLGYSRQELLTKTIGDLSSARYTGNVRGKLGEIENEPYHVFNWELVTKDGRIITVENSSSVIRVGNRRMIMSMYADVSEQLVAERALRESEERFRTAFFTSPDAININRMEDGVYVQINQGFTNLTGYTEDDVRDKTSYDINIWVDIGDRAILVEKLRAQGKCMNLEARFRRKDGSITVGLMSAAVIHIQDEPHVLSVTRDIGQLKRAEEQIVEKEKRFRLLFEETTNPVFLVDRQGKFQNANDAALQFFEVTRDELGNRHVWDFVSPENVSWHQKTHMPVMERRTFETEYVIHGKRKTLVLNVVPFEIEGEGMSFGIGQDITERKMSEIELAERETKYRLLFETMRRGIMFHDIHGRITSVNPSAERILGLTLDEMKANSSSNYNWPAIDENGDNISQENLPSMVAIRTGKAVKDTVMGIYNPRLDSIRWIQITAMPQFREGEQQPFQVYAMFDDITEHKLAEQALRESEERFRTVFEDSPIGIELFDADGNLISCNAAARRLFGLTISASEFHPNIFTDLGVPQEAIEVVRSGRAYSQSVEFDFDDPDIPLPSSRTGKIYFEAVITPLIDDATGMISSYLLQVLDQTERHFAEENRHRLEAQLFQSQKMESVGRLAGGIAHDFNNILTAIIGNTELALMGIEKHNEVYADVAQIKTSAERAANLTRQLLAFSRRQIIEPRTIILNEALMDMERMLRRLIGENIELVTLPAKSLWAVKIDVGQVEQILTNLVVNARDAMPAGGRILIETSNVTLDGEYCRTHAEVEPGNYVLIAVSDNGVGMDAQTAARIFEPFFTTKEKGKGTGLGLSTCYGIVKQNNGSVWVYSEPGHGTTVKIYLPASKEAVPEKMASRNLTDLPSGSETILLVEDEKPLRNMISRILVRKGYRILEASDGEDALAHINEYADVELLITDVIMPRMGGKELAGRLISRFPDIRVLYMSGYTDNSIVHHGVLDEGLQFIQKPFAPDAILRKIRDVLDEK